MCYDNETLKRFWEIEDISSSLPLSLDEEKCKEHCQNTHQRVTNGRLIIPIPFKHSLRLLGESLNKAKQQFLNLEQKLLRNDSLNKS